MDHGLTVASLQILIELLSIGKVIFIYMCVHICISLLIYMCVRVYIYVYTYREEGRSFDHGLTVASLHILIELLRIEKARTRLGSALTLTLNPISMQRYRSSLRRYCPRDSVFWWLSICVDIACQYPSPPYCLIYIYVKINIYISPCPGRRCLRRCKPQQSELSID